MSSPLEQAIRKNIIDNYSKAINKVIIITSDNLKSDYHTSTDKTFILDGLTDCTIIIHNSINGITMTRCNNVTLVVRGKVLSSVRLIYCLDIIIHVWMISCLELGFCDHITICSRQFLFPNPHGVFLMSIGSRDLVMGARNITLNEFQYVSKVVNPYK